jgi:transposase
VIGEVLARLRLLDDARRLGVGAACRRHGVSRQTYHTLKRTFERGGLPALQRRPRGRRPPTPAARAAALALAYEQPDLSCKDAAASLRQRGHLMSALAVGALWRAHGLHVAKARHRLLARARRHPTLADAAKALGTYPHRLRQLEQAFAAGGLDALRPKRRTTVDDDTVLELARQKPALGSTALAQILRARGLRVSPPAVTAILHRHGVRSVREQLREWSRGSFPGEEPVAESASHRKARTPARPTSAR